MGSGTAKVRMVAKPTTLVDCIACELAFLNNRKSSGISTPSNCTTGRRRHCKVLLRVFIAVFRTILEGSLSAFLEGSFKGFQTGLQGFR